jgi:hypothetical protein
MANLFTLKVRQPFFLWAVIFCCLLPFIILPFFNLMASDDYILENFYRHYGFVKTQQMIYFGWTGRFTSTFLGSMFVKFGILEQYYFIHSLLLFFFTWSALFFLLTMINRNLLGRRFTKIRLAEASFLLFFLNIYIQADIASAFYWFSSAMTYQTAFIFFLVLLGCLIKRFSSTHTKKWWNDIVIIILIVLICGCNEVAAVFLVLFFTLLAVVGYYHQYTIPKTLLIYLLVAIAVGVLIAFSSGVIPYRHKAMNGNTSYWSIIPMIVFRSLSVFYYILKEPLFWITIFFVFILGVKVGTNSATVTLLNIFKGKKILIPGLIIIALLVMGTLTPVLMVSKGALPARSLNNLIVLTMLCLLIFFFLIGIRYAALAQSLTFVKIPSYALIIVLGCGLIASVNYIEAWKSVFSGYFYHAVMEDRQQLMLTAKENHQRIITIKPYGEALKEKIHQTFPNGVFATVHELLLTPPQYIFYLNEAEVPSREYLNYYRLDRIIVEKTCSN